MAVVAVGMALAARVNGGARLDAESDVALNPLVLGLTDHGPDRRVRITWGASLDLSEGSLGLSNRLVYALREELADRADLRGSAGADARAALRPA